MRRLSPSMTPKPAQTGNSAPLTRDNQRSPIAPFVPPRWLRNRHLQTVLAGVMPPGMVSESRAEWLELPEGDRLRLVWAPAARWSDRADAADRPLVLLIHGLGGTAQSRYMCGAAMAAHAIGIDAVMLECRGASDQPNRLARAYHAAAWDDLETVAKTLRQRYPLRPLFAVGYSLGGSILLNWLAMRPVDVLVGAVVVSVPFDLEACVRQLDRWPGAVYQKSLLRRVREQAINRFRHRDDAPLSIKAIARIRSIREFDETLTAPLHGFSDAADYYQRASCRQRLGAIRCPTDIIHALDDPLIPASSVPLDHELSPALRMLAQRSGGHVGFFDALTPRGHHWLDRAVVACLEQRLSASSRWSLPAPG